VQVSGELEHARWFTRDELLKGPPLLPPSQSISYRLITTWLRHPSVATDEEGD
jgi:NADH pyrophosphatase NudC (nudix superfamily)